MNPHEIGIAADAFVRHYRRRPCGDWQQAFADWTRFRRLDAGDLEKISAEVHEILFARGDTTEPPPIAA